MNANQRVLEQFWYWIRERESIRVKKETGKPRPWTDDPILAHNHFCNVRREDDRGTKEIRHVVRSHSQFGVHCLPWIYTAARMLNHAPSLNIVLDNWFEKGRPWDHLKEHREMGNKIFHTAYAVSTCGASMDKIDYVAGVVDDVMALHFEPENTCEEVFNHLRTVNGLGSFLAGQVVADLKNDRFLAGADDWWSWSCIGPGSKKGLNYIFMELISERNYKRAMDTLYGLMPEDIGHMQIHAQDLQNCLCEFSKYMAIKLATRGRSRPY